MIKVDQAWRKQGSLARGRRYHVVWKAQFLLKKSGLEQFCAEMKKVGAEPDAG